MCQEGDGDGRSLEENAKGLYLPLWSLSEWAGPATAVAWDLPDYGGFRDSVDQPCLWGIGVLDNSRQGTCPYAISDRENDQTSVAEFQLCMREGMSPHTGLMIGSM